MVKFFLSVEGGRAPRGAIIKYLFAAYFMCVPLCELSTGRAGRQYVSSWKFYYVEIRRSERARRQYCRHSQYARLLLLRTSIFVATYLVAQERYCTVSCQYIARG